MSRLKLHWQILIALVLVVVVGLIAGREIGVFGVTFHAIFDFVGPLFLNALKMLIVPLIVSSIIVGVSGLGGSEHLGRLGGKTLGYYAMTSLLAILVGLILAVDRVLDMMRTAVNVFSDSFGAVIIARHEGEHDVLKSKQNITAPWV